MMLKERTLQDFTNDYISSFNAMIPKLHVMLKHLRPSEIEIDGNERCSLSIQHITINSPKWSDDNERILYPWECRRSHLTYQGTVVINIGVSINGVHKSSIPIKIGSIPIMVKSSLCHIANMSAKELVQHNEEDDELGGYFIVGGNQVMMRYLVATRRNFPILKYRENADKKADRTGHQISISCVREDDTIGEMKIVWNSNSAPDLSLQICSKPFFIPLPYILKALQNKPVFEMFEDVPKTADNISLIENLSMIFDKFNATNANFHSDVSCLEHLGSYFRGIMRCAKWTSNVNVGRQIIDDYIAIHLTDNRSKYDLLITMLIKLHAFVNGQCCEESYDTLNFQDILTPGAMYLLVFKKSLESSLYNAARNLPRVMTMRRCKTIDEAVRASFPSTCLSDMNYFMSTGNIRNGIIAGIKQSKGLRIIVDNINFYRYVANFRAFHRGAFFNDMKSSTIRRLLPESWGFVCPVHTPDGTPCGLLNHFSINTTVQTTSANPTELANLALLLRQHTVSIDLFKNVQEKERYVIVMCDGQLIGFVHDDRIKQLAIKIRREKVIPSDKPIPNVTEIVVINRTQTASQFPGMYLFTTPGRLLRPVINLMFNRPLLEYIGTFEQTYLDIACLPGSVSDGGDMHAYTTHIELSPESLYSFTASFTPYQNYNPSPRNLYQCQMSKQSMGFSYYSTRYRADNKLYCFLAPQIPLCRSKIYDEYKMTKRPLGYNPVVAVASYTGYDMEDAMVINRNSLQRGMGRCCIYKHYNIDLNEKIRDKNDLWYFGAPDGKIIDGLDSDGLPFIGQILIPKKSPVYSKYCAQTKKNETEIYKEAQPGQVINVSLNGSLHRATICIKLERNTVIGDKFASRHGQKGVNSLQVPTIDLPYNEDGIAPDQLFNPHGFPTRMTMGKIIEFIVGKLAALSATVIDSTAFQQSDIVTDYISRLSAHFFDGMGNERLDRKSTRLNSSH